MLLGTESRKKCLELVLQPNQVSATLQAIEDTPRYGIGFCNQLSGPDFNKEEYVKVSGLIACLIYGLRALLGNNILNKLLVERLAPVNREDKPFVMITGIDQEEELQEALADPNGYVIICDNQTILSKGKN